MRPITHLAFVLACGLGFPAPAQGEAEQKIQQLLGKIRSEMAEIDRLLLQTSSREGAKGAQQALKRSAAEIQKLIEQSKNSQDSVVKNIDELIQELQKMSQQRSQQPQEGETGDPSERPQPGQQSPERQRAQQREGVQTPEMVEQQRQQQQQQQGKQQQGQPQPGERDPQGNQKDPLQARQQPGKTPPGQGEEKVDRPGDTQRWGVLPKYLEFMHSRGGMPEVPEKYRRFYESYLKQDRKHDKTPAESGK